MKMSVKNGSPVNPPIWWIDPTDPVAHTINDGKTFYLRVYGIGIIIVKILKQLKGKS